MISDEEKEVYDFRINLSVSKENYMENQILKLFDTKRKQICLSMTMLHLF